jgi:murein DD-endopeptidase MepM/ murein hydrolase activator NlpD
LGSEYEREDRLSYERKPQTVPEFDFINSDFGFSFDVIESMENKVLIGIHMDFEVAVDATEENYDAIKAFVTYLDANKPRLVEALQNLIDPYYEATRASSINMQKGEHERVKQKVTDAEAAGLDPLAAGAYASGLEEAEEMKEGDLRHIVREALKRKLLKEQDLDIDDDYDDGSDPFLRDGELPDPETGLYTGETEEEFFLQSIGREPVSVYDDDPEIAQLQRDIEMGYNPYVDDPEHQRYAELTPIFPFSPEHFAQPEYPMGTGEEGVYPRLTRQRPSGRETNIYSGYGARKAIKSLAKPGQPAKPSLHMGVDISVPKGTPIIAPAPGIIHRRVPDKYPGVKPGIGAGNYVILKTQDPRTGENIYQYFMHLPELPDLEEGEAVVQGQEIGLVGSTGRSTGPHSHWAIAKENPNTGEPYYAPGDYSKYIDPNEYLSAVGGYDWAADYMLQPEGEDAALPRYGRFREIPKDWKTYMVEPEAMMKESQLRYAIQEALKRKLSPLKEAGEMSSALLYQVVLVLSVTKPIRDIKGKLNRIRAIEGVTIVSHEREEETIYRGDVVAKVKFHPPKDMMTPMTFINQYLVPQINDSQTVPEVKVLQVVKGTMKEIT